MYNITIKLYNMGLRQIKNTDNINNIDLQKIDLSKYTNRENLPGGLVKVYKHNRFETGCAKRCPDINCWHGEMGFCCEKRNRKNYFYQ